jgi:hypothetical protein
MDEKTEAAKCSHKKVVEKKFIQNFVFEFEKQHEYASKDLGTGNIIIQISKFGFFSIIIWIMKNITAVIL